MIKTIRNFIKKYKFYFLFVPIIGWIIPIYFLNIEDELNFWYHFNNKNWLYFGSNDFSINLFDYINMFYF